MKSMIKNYFADKWNIQSVRDDFVRSELRQLPKNTKILDAGAGSQRYRAECNDFIYKTQDFCEYKVDEKLTLSGIGMGGVSGYTYGKTDYISNIWEIPAANESFDCILCTEVFEHIPYPNETIREFYRLLAPNGKLILTVPSNCLRHMDPFFFYTGFSDRWIEKIATDVGFVDLKIQSIGDYYSWMKIELGRSISVSGILGKIMLLPAMVYFACKRQTLESSNTLCAGYHVVAYKK